MKKSLLSLCTAAAMTLGAQTSPVMAQEFWLGQIVIGGWNFCPRTTAKADGQLLAISQFSALFSLYGCQFGGDCRTTFALPDLRGRAAVHNGTGPGLSPYPLASRGGRETQTLTILTMPNHTHTIANTVTTELKGSDGAVNSASVAGSALANQPAAHYASRGALDQVMEAGSVAVTVNSTAANTGGNQSFDIRDPYLAVQYCVVTQGIFPSRN